MTNPKQKLYLLISGISAAAILLIAFIIVPSMLEIKNLNEGIALQRLEIEKRYTQIQSGKRITNLTKIKNDIEQLSSIFVKKGSELEFITTLEGIAQANGLEQNINLQTTEQKVSGQIIATPIQISLTGEYLNILKYLSSIEKLDYYITINSLNLSAVYNKKETANINLAKQGLVEAQLNGEVYWETNK